MNNAVDWKRVWEERAVRASSDFQLDRGTPPQDARTEHLAEQALIRFIDPLASETVLDAGCGTGVNILRLHKKVRGVIAIDYSAGSLDRCKAKIRENCIGNAQASKASVTAIPVADRSVDKVLCMSVLQYLSAEEVRRALFEFVRVLKPGGTLILHVKNRSSLYWLTLLPAKKVKALFAGKRQIEYVRPFGWYIDELRSVGCSVLAYDSFNLMLLDILPRKAASRIRAFEVKHHDDFIFRNRMVRQHGAELIIKARIRS